VNSKEEEEHSEGDPDSDEDSEDDCDNICAEDCDDDSKVAGDRKSEICEVEYESGSTLCCDRDSGEDEDEGGESVKVDVA
jgi:hypothetical protein